MSEDLTKKLPYGEDSVALILQNITQLQEGQNRLEGEVREMKISMREIAYQVGCMAETLVKSQGKNREFEERLRDLERQPHKPTNSQT